MREVAVTEGDKVQAQLQLGYSVNGYGVGDLVEAMQAAGIIGEDERFELIGGEVVPMQAKGGRHEMVKIVLNEHLQKTKADNRIFSVFLAGSILPKIICPVNFKVEVGTVKIGL